MLFSPSSPNSNKPTHAPSSSSQNQTDATNFHFDDDAYWADSLLQSSSAAETHHQDTSSGMDFMETPQTPQTPHGYMLTPPSPIYADHELPSNSIRGFSSSSIDTHAIMADAFDDLNVLSSVANTNVPVLKTEPKESTKPSSISTKSSRRRKRSSTTKKMVPKGYQMVQSPKDFITPTPTRSPKKSSNNIITGDATSNPLEQNNQLICTQQDLLADKTYDYWTVLAQNPHFVQLDKKPSKEQLFITIRTRTDPESAHFMNKMYSSLRYSMVFKLNQSTFTEEALKVEGDLKTQCEIVYAESIDRLARNSRTAQFLIQMDNHAPILLKKPDNYETKQKLSFSDVSYHHKNSAFRLKIKVFHTGISHSDSILTIISSPFHLYARRPKTEVKNSRKRKKPGNPSITQPASKRKKTLQSSLQPLQKMKIEKMNEATPIAEEKVELPQNVSNAFGLIEQLQLIKKESSNEEWQQVESHLRKIFSTRAG